MRSLRQSCELRSFLHPSVLKENKPTEAKIEKGATMARRNVFLMQWSSFHFFFLRGLGSNVSLPLHEASFFFREQTAYAR